MAEIEAGNLYDLNKSLVQKNEKPLSKKEIMKQIREEVVHFINPNEKYYMLLCHDQRDYTIFHLTNIPDINTKTADWLYTCITNRGLIYSIEETKNHDAIEIWMQTIDTKEICCYYFFPYTDAVIEVEEEIE